MGMKAPGSLPKLKCPSTFPLPKQNYENYDVISALVSCLVTTKPTRIDLRAATLKKSRWSTFKASPAA